MRQQKGRKGFTIVELLIVMAVISILAAVTVPMLDDILNKAQRQTLEIDISTMNEVLANARTEADTIGFEAACDLMSELLSDSETLEGSKSADGTLTDADRLSGKLGISKRLRTAVLYDTEEMCWIYRQYSVTDNIAELLVQEYGTPRYVLPIRTSAELEQFCESGMSLGLMSDMDAAEERKLLDDSSEVHLTLRGGLSLNGHVLSGVRSIHFVGEDSVAEFLSGAVLYETEDGSEYCANLYFGSEEQPLSRMTLCAAEGENEYVFKRLAGGTGARGADKVGMHDYSVLRIVNVAAFTLSGTLEADSISVEKSGVTVSSGTTTVGTAAVIGTLNETGKKAFLKAGTVMQNGASITGKRIYTGGTFSAGAYLGEGSIVCGPITFTKREDTLYPTQITVDPATMEEKEDGLLTLEVADKNGKLSTEAFEGALHYSVSIQGTMTLDAVCLDGDLNLAYPAAGEETGAGSTHIYEVLPSADGKYRVISPREDGAVEYAVNRMGEVTPYRMTVDRETLTYVAAGENTMTLYAGADGTLYRDSSRTESSGYYFVWNSDQVSSDRFATITYYLYENGLWVKNRENVRYGSTLFLPRPSRSGFDFVAWHLESSLSDDPMTAGKRLTVEGDLTLYAEWEVDLDDPITLSLNFGNGNTIQDFSVIVGGLVFDCNLKNGCEFAQKMVLEGETYDLTSAAVRDEYSWTHQPRYNGDSSDEKYTYIEVHRNDTGILVGSAILPKVSLENGILTVVAYGQNMRVTLPSLGTMADKNYVFDCWEASDGLSYGAGESFTIPAGTSLTLKVKWTNSDTSGVRFSVLGENGNAQISNRTYQWDGTSMRLSGARVTLDGVSYALSRTAEGWELCGGDESYTVTSQSELSDTLEALGLTDTIQLYSASGNSDRTIATAKLVLDDDGEPSVTVTQLCYDGKTYSVEDGAVRGGELTGTVSYEVGADRYSFAVSSVLSRPISYQFRTLTRSGTDYTADTTADQDCFVDVSGTDAFHGKTYEVVHPTKPGSATLKLTEVLYPVEKNGSCQVYRCAVEAGTAALSVHIDRDGLGDCTVHFRVQDDSSSADYTCEAYAFTDGAGETHEVNNGKVTIGDTTYDLSALLADGEATDAAQIVSEHRHSYGFYVCTVDGIRVTVYGCEDCGSYAPSGTSVVLQKNLTLSAPLYIPEGWVYDLDLHGHNIVTTGDAIYNCGTLTLHSDGFSLPSLTTDEDGNLLFASGTMQGYVIVNNGAAEASNSNKNGIINWGTLHLNAVGVAVSDTYGNAVVNAGEAGTTVRNSVILNTGLGNGVYANSGEVTLDSGTVIWSTTYGFAVFAYNDSVVRINAGSYYSTVGFPVCVCGGTLDLNQYCVTDRSADSTYADYVEMDGISGEIYWLAGTIDTTGLSEGRFTYPAPSYGESSQTLGATETSWAFPADFKIVVAMTLEDDAEYEQWSSQIYCSAQWKPNEEGYYEIDTEKIPEYVIDDSRIIYKSGLPVFEDYVTTITVDGKEYKGIRYNAEGMYFSSFKGSADCANGHHAAYSFFVREVNGVQVTAYGCAACGTFAPSGSTIVLQEDLTLTAPLYIPAVKTYTLDLHGHNLVTTGDAIYNCGTLNLCSDGFSLPTLATDEADNLLFRSGEMQGYVIVNNGSAGTETSNKNGIINWGTLHLEAVGVAVSDTYGNAVVNAGDGKLTVQNSVLINTGLGNGLYANGGEATLNSGTVIWSTTYGFAVFAYNDSVVHVNAGSYYSTVGFPVCVCGGTLDLNQYCVTDRSADSTYANYVEMDGTSGEIYWLAGTIDTTGLTENRFTYAQPTYGGEARTLGATAQSWAFPSDFEIVVSMTIEDDIECEQWSSQISQSAQWEPEGTEDSGEEAAAYVTEGERVYVSQQTEYTESTDPIVVDGTGNTEIYDNYFD